MFLAENISSIVILRDVLTKEATKRKIRLDVFCSKLCDPSLLIPLTLSHGNLLTR